MPIRNICSTQKAHNLLFIPHISMILIVSARTIFGHTRTSDNFWTDICLTSRTSDRLRQFFFSETGTTLDSRGYAYTQSHHMTRDSQIDQTAAISPECGEVFVGRLVMDLHVVSPPVIGIVSAGKG